MKNKILLLIAVATLGLTAKTMAQVPNYVPTNGLIGWWPFNGNANDESGNGNNGTVNGASLSTDRFGNVNKAYNFDGVDDVIIVSDNNELRLNSGDFTIALWYKINSYGLPDRHFIFKSDGPGSTNKWGFQKTAVVNGGPSLSFTTSGALGGYWVNGSVVQDYVWHHAIVVRNGILFNIYEDGILLTSVSNIPMQTSTQAIRIGGDEINGGGHWHHGSLDDIGIWNRALSQQEITDLYNGCQLAVNAQPVSQTINININTQFMVGSSDTNATYQWQTDLGLGFQNLSNAGQYSGTTNDTLSVSNVSMSNNNQSFRCIINNGSCADTSNVAVLTINNNVGIHEMAQHNLFSVFPNPAHNIINVKADHKLIGSVFTIYDNTGKAVQSGKINAANTSIELSNLSSGFYMFSLGENREQSFKIIKE
jgi:hypothetical protein